MHCLFAEVRAIVDSMRDEFPGSAYNIITRNCNTFASELSRRLLQRDVPGYVNRLAYLGSFVSCLLPASATGQAPVDAVGSGSSAGGSSSGGVSRFSGSGMSLGGGSSVAASAGTTRFSGEGRSLKDAAGGCSGGGSATGAPLRVHCELDVI